MLSDRRRRSEQLRWANTLLNVPNSPDRGDYRYSLGQFASVRTMCGTFELGLILTSFGSGYRLMCAMVRGSQVWDRFVPFTRLGIYLAAFHLLRAGRPRILDSLLCRPLSPCGVV